MPITKQDLMDTDPEEVFDWEVDNLEARLRELGITIGTKWLTVKQSKPKVDEPSKPKDPTVMMMEASRWKHQDGSIKMEMSAIVTIVMTDRSR